MRGRYKPKLSAKKRGISDEGRRKGKEGAEIYLTRGYQRLRKNLGTLSTEVIRG